MLSPCQAQFHHIHSEIMRSRLGYAGWEGTGSNQRSADRGQCRCELGRRSWRFCAHESHRRRGWITTARSGDSSPHSGGCSPTNNLQFHIANAHKHSRYLSFASSCVTHALRRVWGGGGSTWQSGSDVEQRNSEGVSCREAAWQFGYSALLSPPPSVSSSPGEL